MIPLKYIGSIKYEGKLVDDGLIEARAAARALTGVDKAVRYFIAQDDAGLAAIDLPLPVQIRKGSWETLIPNDIVGWIKAASALVATAYFTAAAKKIAENGFKDETVTSLIRKALCRIQDLITIGKHLGHISIVSVKGLKWDKEEMVGLPNRDGKVLYIPIATWKKLANCPKNLLTDIVTVVDEHRTLTVGVRIGRKTMEVTVRNHERRIFVSEDDDLEPVLFPHLTHGMEIELEGIVTRENGRTKTLGFYHEGHVLTCMPASGNIVPYKKHLYLRCRMHGRVTRADEKGNPTEKRPKIVFSEIIILSDKEQMVLGFDDPEAE